MNDRLRIEVRYEDERDYRLLAVGCNLEQLAKLASEVVVLSGISDIRISITDEPYEFRRFTL